ncbi:unnamed protein product [Phaedon cochleariae]|uniref:IST1 homolog n=1 Tax=Phaedon cochleariae TaxID=80249 RepID=A0A9N9SLZ9_PHACE|nr:unnamed protein product [Phaedon cochleariae]
MNSTIINYEVLKENLINSVITLKLFQKKKTQQIKNLKQEIGECMLESRQERAKIRMKYVISATELNESIADAVSSLIWVAPRFKSDITELSIVSDLLGLKYGKSFVEDCRSGIAKGISEKLRSKLSIQSQPETLLEKYMSDIGKIYNIQCEPDSQAIDKGVWDLDDDDIDDEQLLHNKMLNFEVPNSVLAIPNYMKDLISKCLSYIPEERPEVHELLYFLTIQ